MGDKKFRNGHVGQSLPKNTETGKYLNKSVSFSTAIKINNNYVVQLNMQHVKEQAVPR